MITKATGRDPYFVGKPNPMMFRSALNRIEAHSENTMMVGDRMDTDVVAGIEAGLDTILVLTGSTTVADIERYPFRPSRVLDSIADASNSFDPSRSRSRGTCLAACHDGPRRPAAAVSFGRDRQCDRGRGATACRQRVVFWGAAVGSGRSCNGGPPGSARCRLPVPCPSTRTCWSPSCFRAASGSYSAESTTNGGRCGSPTAMTSASRPETTRRVGLRGWGPDSVLAALGIAKPDDVELEVVVRRPGAGRDGDQLPLSVDRGTAIDPRRRGQERDLRRRHAVFDLCSGCDHRR